MIRPSPPATASLLVDCTGAGGINCGRCCHDKCLFFSQKTRSIWVDLVILNHVSSNGLFYGTCKREWLWTLRFYGTSTLWAMTFFSWRTLAIEGSINSDYSFSRKIGLVIRQFASSYDKLLILSSSPGSYRVSRQVLDSLIECDNPIGLWWVWVAYPKTTIPY